MCVLCIYCNCQSNEQPVQKTSFPEYTSLYSLVLFTYIFISVSTIKNKLLPLLFFAMLPHSNGLNRKKRKKLCKLRNACKWNYTNKLVFSYVWVPPSLYHLFRLPLFLVFLLDRLDSFRLTFRPFSKCLWYKSRRKNISQEWKITSNFLLYYLGFTYFRLCHQSAENKKKNTNHCMTLLEY